MNKMLNMVLGLLLALFAASSAFAQVSTSPSNPSFTIKFGPDSTVSHNLWQNVGGAQSTTGPGSGNFSFQSQGNSFMQNDTTNLSAGSAVNATGFTSSGRGGTASAGFSVNSSAGGFGGIVSPSLTFSRLEQFYDPGFKGVSTSVYKGINANASSTGNGAASVNVGAEAYSGGTFNQPTYYSPVFAPTPIYER